MTHDTEAEIFAATSIRKPVIIEDNVWIGTGAVILPGVRLGTGCIIGAGSVVTKDACLLDRRRYSGPKTASALRRVGMLLKSIIQRGSRWLSSNAVKSNVLAGLLVQVGRPLVALLTLPLLLSYLGQEGLGIWMIALSLMGLFSFVSAGLSASVVTAIGRASAEASEMNLHRMTTAATLIATLWGGVVLVLAVPAVLLVDWAALLGLGSSPWSTGVGKLMAVLVALMGFGIVAAVPRQIMVGRMHGYLAHLFDFAGVVAGAIGLIIGLNLGAPLWLLGLVFMGPSSLTLLIGGLIYLHHAGIPLVSRQHLHRETFVTLGRDSLRMAGYQSAYAVSSQSDLLLIGMILGAPASAAYGIAQRVFSLPILVSATVNYAQWPAMARADSAGEHALVRRMFRHTLAIGSGAATVVAIGAALAYQPLIELWLGHRVETDPMILVGMVAWVLVATLVNTCDSVLRAQNHTAFLMLSMITMAVINIAVTLLLLPRIGPAGAIWGSVTGFTLALLLPYLIRLRGMLGVGNDGKPADVDAN